MKIFVHFLSALALAFGPTLSLASSTKPAALPEAQQDLAIKALKAALHQHVADMDPYLYNENSDRDELIDLLKAKIVSAHEKALETLPKQMQGKLPNLEENLAAIESRYLGMSAQQIAAAEIVAAQEKETSCLMTVFVLPLALDGSRYWSTGEWIAFLAIAPIVLPLTLAFDIVTLPICLFLGLFYQ